MAAFIWNPGTTGTWNTATNWSPTQVPSAGDLILIVPDATLEIDSTATIGDVVLAGGNLLIDATADVTVSDRLQVEFGTLTNAGAVTVGAIENAGRIDNTGLLLVTGGSVVNTGTIDDAGTVQFSGAVATPVLAQIGGSGWIDVIGTLVNAGQVPQTGGPLLVVHGTVQGGTVDAALSGWSDATFAGVTLAGTFTTFRPLTILDGLTGTASGALTAPLGADLTFGNDETLAALALSVAGMATVSGTLTLDRSVVWSVPASTFGTRGLDLTGPGTVINDGTILAASGSGLWQDGFNGLTIDTALFENAGVLSAVDASTASAGGFSPLGQHTGTTTIRFEGGTVVNTVGGIIETGQGDGLGRIEIAATTTFINDGVLSVKGPGSRQGGILDIGTDLLGSGRIEIGGGGQVTLAAAAAASQTIVFTGPGTLALGGQSTMAAAIEGFGPGDTIMVGGIVATPVRYHDGTLELDAGGTPLLLSLHGTWAPPDVPTSSGGAIMVPEPVACFAAGTRIETATGPVRVEALRVGDPIRTLGGALRPVRWVGWRHVACALHPQPDQAWPVRIARDAMADGCPRRPVLLSPDHAVFIDDVLIPVRLLVNGRTIARRKVATITYYHVELDAHDILLADGLPAETYLDTGDRWTFTGTEAIAPRRPPPGVTQIDLIREAQACAPLVVTGEALAAIRLRLGQQADRLAAKRRAARGRPA